MTNYLSDERVLDQTLNLFYSGQDDAITYTQFCYALNQLRKKISNHEWKRFIYEVYRNHPLMDFIVQEPFTQHALFKYKDTGASVLMDFIYAAEGLVESPFTGYETKRGLRLHHGLMTLSTCIGVRNARKMIEKKIDDVLRTSKHAHFMSFPSGHLREIVTATAGPKSIIPSLRAFDYDQEALSFVTKEWGHLGLSTNTLTIQNFNKILKELQPIDFIWSNGLLNEVENLVAKDLILGLFNYLKQGGWFLLTAFSSTHLLSGYMEVCCDWWPIYRDELQLIHLVEKIITEKRGMVNTYKDPTGSILFLEIVKVKDSPIQ